MEKSFLNNINAEDLQHLLYCLDGLDHLLSCSVDCYKTGISSIDDNIETLLDDIISFKHTLQNK